MNYRHAFHAGNFADVFKHLVLTRILVHLQLKPAAFRVIETHAGAGRYDLEGPEASRTGEWRSGIGAFLAADLPPRLAELAAPYCDAVKAANPAGRLSFYPGSPSLAQHLLREQDRLTACELQPEAVVLLKRALGRDRRCRAVAIDGWRGLMAFLPPKERRGLVLIDPPYEAANEFTELQSRIVEAHGKWPTGLFLVWYPIKERRGPDRLAQALVQRGVPRMLRAELEVAAAGEARLFGCGLLIINPPWTLADELAVLLPGLAAILAPPGIGRFRIDRLTAEK